MQENKEFSLLIGGKAGDGIDRAGLMLARILNRLGYRIYILRDYPSLIRGGHTFSLIRASKNSISAHCDKIDFLLALNQETVNLHKHRLKDKCFFIYDSSQINLDISKECGIGIPLESILKQENLPSIMRNSILLGAFCKVVSLDFNILEEVLKKEIKYELELNLKAAKNGYELVKEVIKLEDLKQEPLPILTGNEAIGLGLIKAGLKSYIAYPMTPSSGLLHFLAEVSGDFSIKVIHPENEISVILLALGFSYTGERSAVGTSGGGFCLMTESLSLAGMAELPVVIVLGQRTGPSTGLPTYTAQADLLFALNAGHGEFVRLIVAPGDIQEAYLWAGISLNLAWKYQIPAIILSDKTLSEGVYSFDYKITDKIKEEKPLMWDKKTSYKRYLDTESGVSFLEFVPSKEAVIKVNSYEHDEFGITTEDPEITTNMVNKRLRKGLYLLKDIESYNPINIFGDKKSPVALICWGSNKGVVSEVASELGLRAVQPVVLSPFPVDYFKAALEGVKKTIVIECNATSQLSRLLNSCGFRIDQNILKYNGRPFSLEELKELLKKVI